MTPRLWLRSCAWAAAAILVLGGCDRVADPAGPDPAPPSPDVAVRLLGLPGPVRYAGEIVAFRADEPSLAVTLEGTTVEPPATIELNREIEHVQIELAKTQVSGTLRVEVLVDGRVVASAQTNAAFEWLHLDVDV